MPRLDTVLVVLLAMPSVASATNPAASHREIRTDHRPQAVEREWNERDARELSDFARLAAALKDAGRDRMTGRYREVNARVQEAMEREIQQAQVKSAQAAQEERLTRRKVGAGRMEASMSGDAPAMFGPGDDARDLRDDARDRDNSRARHEEMVRIGTMSTALQNRIDRGDRAAIKQNIELAESFLALLRRDLTAAQAEAAEDRAGLRER